MSKLVALLPLLAALAAAPAFAADTVRPAAHHPSAKAMGHASKHGHSAKTAAMQRCPMMDGKMASGHGAMASGGMMKEGEHMHCMMGAAGKADGAAAQAPGKPPTEAPADEHSHEH